MTRAPFALVESNTTGTGRLFAAAAYALGMRPVLLAADPARYPYAREDGLEVREIDTLDQRAVLRVCRELTGLAGVSTSSDYFTDVAARAAAELGLPGPDPEALRAARDKGHQRRLLDGVEHRRCGSAAEAEAAARDLGGPVVVKPCAGSGSEGVRRCDDPAQARDWAARLLSRTTNERGIPIRPEVLVEAYVAGPEYSAEAIGGRVVAIAAKHVSAPPYFVEVGHDVPAALGRRTARTITSVVEHALRVLGLDAGPTHTEIRLSTDGPVIIEVNGRLAGGMIPRLVHLATGLDMITTVVAQAAGLPVTPEPRSTAHSSIRFLVPPHDGRLAKVSGVADARDVPGVVEAVCTLTPGAWFAANHSFRDRVGHVISCADTAEQAVRAADAALSRIELVLEGER